MGTRTKNQIVLKKQKCGGFLFKIFEHESLIRSTIVALAGNVWWLGEVPPCRMLKFSTNAYGGILPNHCYKPFYSCLA